VSRLELARVRARRAKLVLATLAVVAFLLALVLARADAGRTSGAGTELQAPQDLVQQLGDDGLSSGQVGPAAGAPQVQSRSS
jgi:hypothetical protein